MLKYSLGGLFIICTILSAQNTDSLIDVANELYETRHVDPENLGKSRDILENIIENEPENVRALYELSKVYYQLGDGAEKKDEKLRLYNTGKEYGKKAKKVDDNSADAHFWYMVNLGRIGQTKGVLHSLGSVPEMKKEIDKVLEIDSTHTGALDVKAMFYYELPGLLGGNLNKSIEALNKAIALDSNYALLYVDMGRVYMKKKNYDKARWYLNKVLEIEKPTYEADYVLDDKPDALKLLEEIREK